MNTDPQQIIATHEQAMALADKAQAARRARNEDGYDTLLREAFKLEKQAALMIESEESEPTRSALHRSAASLAYKCKLYRDAEWLIARALIGNPPDEILDELRRLSSRVTAELRQQEPQPAVTVREAALEL